MSKRKRKAIAGKKHQSDNINVNAPINVDTLKRARRYEIIALVFMFLMCLLPLGYSTLAKNSVNNAQTTCWKNEQTIEALAQQYVTVNGLSSYPTYVEDIPSFNEIAQQCPIGGSYTWNPIVGEYSCSVHQHYPEGFNESQSIRQGTTITEMTTETN